MGCTRQPAPEAVLIILSIILLPSKKNPALIYWQFALPAAALQVGVITLVVVMIVKIFRK